MHSRRSFLGHLAAAAGALAGLEACRAGPEAARAPEDRELEQGLVRFPNGGQEIDGYLARRRGAARRPAVLVLHGNAALPPDIRDTAARLAEAGFVGLAVSSTSREPDPSTITREFVSSQRYMRRYLDDARAAIGYLRRQPYVSDDDVGVWGYCGGGIAAIELAVESPEIGAIAAFYAAPRFPPDRNSPEDPRPDMISFVPRLRSPIQCHYGTADASIPAGDIADMERALAETGVPAEVYRYAGAGHAFCDYTRPALYQPEAARLATDRAVGFLRRRLLERRVAT